MTVPVQTPSTTILAAGGQTIFPFNFRCDDSTTIHVFADDVERFDGVVALNADQTAAPGGTVTLPAQAVGVSVTIERQGSQQQSLAISAYGAFQAASLMLGLDRLVMLVQEFYARLSRTASITRKNLALMSTTDLPTPTNGSLLKWVDAGGGKSKLDNTTVESVGVISVVEGEIVTRTGAGTYQLAHVPNPLARVKLYLNGVRVWAGTHYTITAGGAITFLAGFIPAATETLLADYYY